VSAPPSVKKKLTSAKKRSVRRAKPHVTTAPAVLPPPSVAAQPPQPTAPAGCYPLSNGGNCYEPGEYCRNSDHGASGRAGDGEMIVCAYNDGWRWEPA
jgi:hypothetical protein